MASNDNDNTRDDAANDDDVVSLEGAAFGRHLEGLRKQRGLSREEFSGRSGLSIATIRQIEKGQGPGLDSLRKIGLGLDLPLSALFAKFEEQDAAAIHEISWLLRGRDPKLLALVTQIVRTIVQAVDTMTSRDPL